MSCLLIESHEAADRHQFRYDHIHDFSIAQRDLRDELTVSIQLWIANNIADDGVDCSNLYSGDVGSAREVDAGPHYLPHRHDRGRADDYRRGDQACKEGAAGQHQYFFTFLVFIQPYSPQFGSVH
jgi:hypothetical protein